MARRWTSLYLALCLAMAATAGHAQGAGYYHQVTKSSTVHQLARALGVEPGALARANKLRMDAALKAGTRLWVPGKPPARTSTPTTASNSSRPRGVVQPVKTPTPKQLNKSTPVSKPASERPSGSGTYTVRRGDSLWSVADAHGLTINELARLNGLKTDAQLLLGQRLVVPTVHQDIPGGGVKSSEQRKPSTQESPSRASSTSSSKDVTRGLPPSKEGFIWPVEGRLIRRFRKTSEEMYTGIDIAVPRGTEVRAAKEGKVVYAGSGIPGYGNLVIVQHDTKTATVYAHNDRLLVREGQKVSRGQAVARSGDSGKGNEPFLHFELRRNGDAVNPEPFLP
jgi:LysM repeat protein